jgi:hypothetical protein
MDNDEPPHESPAKKQLEEGLAKMGKFASPVIQKVVADALANLDHTNPQKVRDLLPPETHAFYLQTSQRCATLMPLIKRAHENGCFIESIVLAHGLIQFSLRGLYVMAWQRAVMPTPLTIEQLAPYYKQRHRKGDVHPLIETLENNGLLHRDPHGNHLRSVNDIRNKAAHGIIFGEIVHADLAESSRKCQWAAVGMLDTFRAWFNNPRPLKTLPT